MQVVFRSSPLILGMLCAAACNRAAPADGSKPEPPASNAAPERRTAPPATRKTAAASAALPAPDKPKVPMAADGLPVSIPLPGSRLPTVQDWKHNGQEVRIAGAKELGCEAWMIREWIRLSCAGDKGGLGKPQSAETTKQAGAPAYIFARAGEAIRVETQLIPGRTYQAELTWHDGKRGFEIRWPRGQARPQVRFVDAVAEPADDKHAGKSHKN